MVHQTISTVANALLLLLLLIYGGGPGTVVQAQAAQSQTLTVITRPEALITSSGSVVEGSVIQVYCTVEVADSISFEWTLNGMTLLNDPAHLRIRSNTDDGETTSVLTVDNFRDTDNGVYLCSATNTSSMDVSNGTAVSLTAVNSTIDGTLMIVSEPSDNQASPLDANHTGIGLGDTVDGSLLTCIAGHQGDGVMNYSQPTVVWIRNGRPVDDTDSRITATSTTMANGQLSSSLTITGFTVSDGEVYQCVFIDSEGSGAELITTKPFRLDTGNTVIIERISPEIIVLRLPEKLVIEVRATGEYQNIYWNKNENQFGDTNFPITFPDEFPNFLEIFVREITTADDIGIYGVQPTIANDNVGTHNILPTSQGVDFAVIAPEDANTTSLELSPVVVLEGENVSITCRSVGVPAPSISWELDNQTTPFEQSDTVTQFVATLVGEIGNRIVNVDPGNIVSDLHIVSATYPDHDGVYTCIGSNNPDDTSVFTSSASVAVQVHVVPEVEVTADITRVNVGDSVTLTCSVLRGNPSNYVYSIVHVDTMDTSTGPTKMLTIEMSDIGTYRCDVTNDAGTGSANITIALGVTTVQRVNDTAMGDPVMTVPLNVNTSVIPKFPTDSILNLCFELHGEPDRYFNLVSDSCVSINAHYQQLSPQLGYTIIDEIAVKAAGNDGVCREVGVSVEQCRATMDGHLLNGTYASAGISVRMYRNRVRIAVSNCNNLDLVMWVFCEERQFVGDAEQGEPDIKINAEMIKFVIARGLNLREMAHGILGQFWNVPVRIEKYNGPLLSGETRDNMYIVTVNYPGQDPRQFLSMLHTPLWDRTRHENCLYAGNSQGGQLAEIESPNSSVIEGDYKEYIVSESFDFEFPYSHFNDTKCLPISKT